MKNYGDVYAILSADGQTLLVMILYPMLISRSMNINEENTDIEMG